MVQSARGSWKKNDPKAASIQLKNALRKIPASPKRASCSGGFISIRAMCRAHSRSSSAPASWLFGGSGHTAACSRDGHGWRGQGDDRAVRQHLARRPASQAQLQATLGEAYLGTGAPDKAEALPRPVRTRVPGIAPGLGLARERGQTRSSKVPGGKSSVLRALMRTSMLVVQTALLNAGKSRPRRRETYSPPRSRSNRPGCPFSSSFHCCFGTASSTRAATAQRRCRRRSAG